MSVDYWLFSCCIDDNELETIRKDYENTIASCTAPLDYNLWLSSNEQSMVEVCNENHRQLHEFTWIFNDHNLNDFTKKVTSEHYFKLNKDNIIDFISISDMPPVALIAYAIGPEKFRQLPGYMGCSLLEKSHFDHSECSNLWDAELILDAKIRAQHFLSAAYSPCKGEVDSIDVAKVLGFFPRAEQEAHKRKGNLLTLSSRAT